VGKKMEHANCFKHLGVPLNSKFSFSLPTNFSEVKPGLRDVLNISENSVFLQFPSGIDL